MSISELNSNEEHCPLVSCEIELSTLDGQIQRVMREITATNEEIRKINNELERLDPTLVGKKTAVEDTGGVMNRCSSLFSRARKKFYKTEIEELQKLKSEFGKLKKQYHEQLIACEEAFKKCEVSFQKGPVSQQAPQSPEQENLIVTVPTKSLGLSKIEPVGRGLDPEFMQFQERAQKIFEKAMSSEAIKELYIEAVLTPNPYEPNQTGSWALIFNTKEADPNLRFGAYTNIAKREIHMSVELLDETALSAFVFELTNAVHSPKINTIRQQALTQPLSREQYVRQMEYIEYTGALLHHQIMKSAIIEKGWDESLDRCKDIPISFEEHWAQIRRSQHADSYREIWNTLIKPLLNMPQGY